MFMIMLGFTFFSASMWVGQNLSDGLDFKGFIGALLIGGLILRVILAVNMLEIRRSHQEAEHI